MSYIILEEMVIVNLPLQPVLWLDLTPDQDSRLIGSHYSGLVRTNLTHWTFFWKLQSSQFNHFKWKTQNLKRFISLHILSGNYNLHRSTIWKDNETNIYGPKNQNEIQIPRDVAPGGAKHQLSAKQETYASLTWYWPNCTIHFYENG